ncbi:FAD-dependent oxidoreductase [Paenibacillus alkaliterrae]|uniref:NAD(P)/FAD-dependent oxidoreductase n=1 Tax=Paenibacillus alkaliterrae TaxID=320909 RepID=UPI001F2B5081|nr:FAD-dependent oxidoreductase [Paenibacillus alkaliterrae]MCF2940863.1 FAD-dependent oxidoreductase [Paenibacillus alkaliterrae]
MKSKRQQSDLIIVGAGPAGLAAAAAAAENGLSVTIIDEFPEPGGRMLGQFHEERGHWWVGKRIADELIEKNRAQGVLIRCGVSVYGMLKVDDMWEVSTSHGTMLAPRVLLATGAAEIPMPANGWTLPGVMSIGAAQVMTNVHYVKPGKRGIIVGVNVLAMAIARELSVSGVSLASIVLPPSGPFAGKAALPKENLQLLMSLSHLAPSPILRFGGKIANALGLAGIVSSLFPRSGIKLWDIPLKLRTKVVSINGTDRVESVTLADVNGQGEIIAGSEREEAVDFVALAGGLYPLAELASIAGCPFIYTPELGGHLPLHSERMKTPVEGLYVAGNITGVESALVAMAQGQLAATSICSDAGIFGHNGESKVAAAIEEVHRVRASALIQFHPGIPEARRKIYRMWQETFGAGV